MRAASAPSGEAREPAPVYRRGRRVHVGSRRGLEQLLGPGEGLEQLHGEAHQRGMGRDVGGDRDLVAPSAPLIARRAGCPAPPPPSRPCRASRVRSSVPTGRSPAARSAGHAGRVTTRARRPLRAGPRRSDGWCRTGDSASERRCGPRPRATCAPASRDDGAPRPHRSRRSPRTGSPDRSPRQRPTVRRSRRCSSTVRRSYDHSTA